MTTRTQPPLPMPTAQTPRRHRAASYSSSSSSSSSFSTVSSASSSPSPSPRTTSVPFSWEHHPGIPKNNNTFLRRGANPATSPPTPLPLPPPLRAPLSGRRANRPVPRAPVAADPFAAALAECTRERANTIDIDALFPPTPTSAVPGGHRRWSIAASGVAGFLDLHGCKTAMAVAEGAFVVRRPVVAVGVGRAGQGRTGRPGRR